MQWKSPSCTWHQSKSRKYVTSNLIPCHASMHFDLCPGHIRIVTTFMLFIQWKSPQNYIGIKNRHFIIKLCDSTKVGGRWKDKTNACLSTTMLSCVNMLCCCYTLNSFFLFSDWPKAYSEFLKAAPLTPWRHNCRLYNHVKDTQGHG